jgi:hypothetical protein
VSRFSGALALVLWMLTCMRWFDPAMPFRPRALAVVPPSLLATACLASLVWWLQGRWRRLMGTRERYPAALLLVVILALFFRLPMVWSAAAGYLTPDGSLAGMIAVHLRHGVEHLVFVPDSGYTGSLKAHLAVLLSFLMDMPRAFAFASVLFYAFFVAAVYRLGALADPSGPTGLYAGVYVAFAPAWVTHYSLSNDGNYIEVLALGAWALFLAALWIADPENRPLRATGLGVLLGLAFWCHVLAVIYMVAIGIVLAAFGGRALLRSMLYLVVGWVAGFFPGLLWNATNGWFSFGYLTTGAHQDRPVDVAAFRSRIVPMVTDHWPILLGYDSWYPPFLDAASRALAWFAIAAVVVAVGLACKIALRKPAGVATVLLVFTVTNLGMALLGSEHIPGNPRYLLFLMSSIPVFLSLAFGSGLRRMVLGAVVTFGALGSIATLAPSAAADARWRAFVGGLEGAGVRWCYADFSLAAKINFLSEERVLCSSRLGPTFTDYYHCAERVGAAPAAAFIPINKTQAAKLQVRLEALGVSYERLDLMKPVLCRLSKKVDPDELRGGPQPPGSTRR